MPSEPVPQRLADADRDEAVTLLREHYEAGRLTEAEFADRMERALAARVSADLAPLFDDLPGQHPSSLVPGSPVWTTPPAAAAAPSGGLDVPAPAAGRVDTPVPEGIAQYLPVIQGVLWPAVIVAALFTGNWTLWIVIGIVGSIVVNALGNRRTPPPSIGS